MSEFPNLDNSHLGLRSSSRSRLAHALGVAACVIGMLATVVPLWPLARFYQIPRGTVMRPMALTAILGLFAAAGLLISLPLTIGCFALGWRAKSARWLALFGLLFSASAVFLGSFLFHWIVAMRGFVLED